ncbi:ABC transporter permease [Desulfosarcina ovata]|uniref:Multidrug ABC transporter substrate-binding protein n=2 Tax=Desulfosarcina ovata TaxID=83564 RepID=A0A5K8AJ97_9BACT|nr:ABC transporter permease [Desulfosarcina ovata]BBO85717.1 multidrug ABC transporter substrate-binding protein [Desulfosarcina ovata subsp. sediminis]BBO92762.1 multidrug ABC transporter substrate-binding protein [Desulfosarcina ovata subsp. ovata]
MMLWETFLLAQRTIRRNVMRSSLTILGIVIGVAAVILMVTLGSGATAKVTRDISRLGSNMLHVRPGQGMRGPGGARSSSDQFTVADATAIRNSVAGLSAVAPTAQTSKQAIHGSANWSTSVTGATNAYLTVQGWELAEGRVFSDAETKAGKGVCLIGHTVQKELFGSESPIGKAMRLEAISFRVIGTLKEKGQSSFGDDQDDIVIIPLRTLQRRMTGTTDVGTILVSVADGISTETVKSEIESLMRERRGIRSDQEDDFHVRDMKELIDTLTGTTTVLTALLSAVAGVSLLVGGIGIMNIMMVSVTERTREIGTRLAIGALEREVLMQFLVEAVVLASFGGLIGIATGLCGAAVGSRLIGVPFVFRPGIVAAAFLFSGAVGIAFGYFPARKAAQLNPIEALRYE